MELSIENKLLQEQLLQEAFLDSVKAYAREKYDDVINKINDWKDVAAVIGQVMSNPTILQRFSDDVWYNFKRNTLKRLIDFLNKLGLNNLVASINNVVTKITDLTGWQKFIASVGIGAIAKHVIDKMSGLAPDAIKNFIVSYLSENGLQTLITKLASFNAFVGWIQPIIKGVEMLYEVMKSSIEKFLYDSSPFTHRINLIRREGLDEEKRAALKSAIKAYAREIMMNEENVTGSGASFSAGSGENYATPKAFGKKGENRAVKFLKKMGWTVADLTLPKNSKMFDYKKIYEMKLNDIIEQGVLNEVSYGKFKKEVTYRTKSEQLHKAIREVKRKLQEIDRIVEYTSRMKQELSEGEDGIKYWKATQKNVSNISEMVNQLNNKIKNLNQ
jgi:predicted transcriptional regulator